MIGLIGVAVLPAQNGFDWLELKSHVYYSGVIATNVSDVIDSPVLEKYYQNWRIFWIISGKYITVGSCTTLSDRVFPTFILPPVVFLTFFRNWGDILNIFFVNFDKSIYPSFPPSCSKETKHMLMTLKVFCFQRFEIYHFLSKYRLKTIEIISMVAEKTSHNVKKQVTIKVYKINRFLVDAIYCSPTNQSDRLEGPCFWNRFYQIFTCFTKQIGVKTR